MFKRSSGAFAGFLLAASPAVADGMQAPIKVAPVFAGTSWTGCYLGADTGYKWGRGTLTTPSPYRLNNPTNTVVATSPEQLTTNGGIVGGQIGCNYQLAPRIIIGFEASATRDWAQGKDEGIVTATALRVPAAVGTLSTESNRTCQYRIGPRVGTTLPGSTGLGGLSTHLYATGGYAAACYSTRQVGQFADPFVTNRDVSTSTTIHGWYAGVGTDIPTSFLIPNTFFQLEYTHAEYQGVSVALAGTFDRGRLENATDEIRLGFKYMFGSAASERYAPMK